MADQNGIPGAADVIGLDFGLGTPSEEFINARVHFFDSNSISRVLNALIYTGAELRIGVRKIARARGLQFWVFRLGDEESIRDGFHGHSQRFGLAARLRVDCFRWLGCIASIPESPAQNRKPHDQAECGDSLSDSHWQYRMTKSNAHRHPRSQAP